MTERWTAEELFLATVAAGLPRGPSRARSAILEELRDGLLASIEAQLGSGLAEDEARERTLREFGDPQTLADSFWPELAAARARRAVLGALLTGPIVIALWVAAARSRGAGHAGGLFDGAAAHITAAVLISAALLAGLGTIVLTGRLTRSLAASAHTQLGGAAITTSVIALTDLALLLVLSWRLAAFPGVVHILLCGAAVLSSGCRLIIAVRSTRLCLVELRRYEPRRAGR